MSELPELELSSAVVEVLGELTPDEERERHRLELRVERAFSEGCFALRSLRDKKLYRSTHSTFENYVLERFGMKRAHAYRLINAATVVENLSPIGDILPTNESVCRYLATLSEPDTQREAWRQILEEKDGGIPTAKDIKGIVERLREKPLLLASDYCKQGEVFFLQRLTGTEIKYNGSWAIAIEVENRFTVKAAVYNAVVEVKPENMKRIDSEQTQAEIKEIYERIRRLLECQLDPIDEVQIELLCRRPWFTPRQKQALSALEIIYRVQE